jgi:hypothetical protein
MRIGVVRRRRRRAMLSIGRIWGIMMEEEGRRGGGREGREDEMKYL